VRRAHGRQHECVCRSDGARRVRARLLDVGGVRRDRRLYVRGARVRAPQHRHIFRPGSRLGRGPRGVVVMRADLVVHGGLLVTMDAERRVFADGGIAVRDGSLIDVGPSRTLLERYQPEKRVDVHGLVIMPGLVNAHVHLTGLDLLPGLEPSDSPSETHLQNWAIPSHVVCTPDDERVTARFLALALLKQGITAFIYACTNRFPEAVLERLVDVAARGAVGTWTWDRWHEPPEFDTTTDEAIARMCRGLELSSERLKVWPILVGHTSCSDELWQAAAGEA